MDIRKFFGGSPSTKPSKPAQPSANDLKKKGASSSTTKDKPQGKEKKKENRTPQKATKAKKVSKPDFSDSEEFEIIDSSEAEDFTALKSKRKSKEKTPSKSKEKTPSKSAVDKNGNKKELKGSEKKRKKVQRVSSDEEDVIVEKKPRSRSKKGKRGGIIYDSESEEEDPVPKEQKKRRKSGKKNSYVTDSDEEPSKPSALEAAFKKADHKPSSQVPPKKAATPVKPVKTTSVMDFFGVAPVQRTERKGQAGKRKAEPSPVKLNGPDVDMEIHDDDDFEQTLMQIDSAETRQPSKRLKTEEPAQPETSGKGGGVANVTGKSLASKLAEKTKASSHKPDVLVTETPERPSSKTPMKLEKSPKKETSPRGKKHSPMQITPNKTTPPKAGSSSKSPSKVSPSKGPSPNAQKGESPEGGTPPSMKKGSSYRSYLFREGPKALGSKEVPEGAENCMEGLTFVITGVMESLERDEAKSLVEKYGGKVTGSVSKKTNYLVVGRDAGESKIAKAKQFGTKQIDEDGLLDLIRSLPGKKSKYEVAAEKEIAQGAKDKLSKWNRSSPGKPSPSSSSVKPKTPSTSNTQSFKEPSQKQPSPQKATTQGSGEHLLWVDKYKPQSLKQIIGQQGDKSNARKLLHWLNNWHRNIASGKKPAFNRFSDDGSGYRAALLSGPPGVGKTTTATLVCQDAGFSFVELNASDTRSKRSLKEHVAEALNNHTLVDYFGAKSGSTDGQRHCLVMDEVDGMAGNEDRGGMAELLGLIKGSKIPIICMCNDRNHPKIRSLANHCFDLRFQRPRVEQIKAAMMSLAFKEGLKIPPPALQEVILAANQDIRQVIHNLSMWTSKEKNLSYEQAKVDANKAKKDLRMGPFDVCRLVFAGGEETAKMTVNDKSDLFFQDYSIGPLFVQENYISCSPYAARGNPIKHLSLLSKAADSIAQGDLVDRHIRSSQDWSLLPTQALFASVLPGDIMRGGIGQMIQFPSWLGKNSSRNKHDRILQELRTHMGLKVSGDKRALGLDYLPHLRQALTQPLVHHGQDGVPTAVAMLADYDLTREDFDSVLEVSTWPNSVDPMSRVESKVKAAFTRTYNKESHMTPYASGAMSKKGRGRGGGGGGEGLLGEEGEGEYEAESEEEEDDITKDSMIKQKKKTGGGGGSTTSKGKASAKGGGKGGKGKGKKK